MTAASDGLASNSQRRGVTPLVLLLNRSGNIAAKSGTTRCFEQLRMQRGHSIGAVRTDDREIRHADLTAGTFLDQAHATDARFIAGKPDANIVEEAPVDFVNDFQIARQHVFKPRHGPFLQRLGQQRVVRVGERSLCDCPGVVPAELCLVEQYSHQLRHGQRRMCVVELNCGMVRQCAPIIAGGAETADQVGQRTGDEKVFLKETQPLAVASC